MSLSLALICHFKYRMTKTHLMYLLFNALAKRLNRNSGTAYFFWHQKLLRTTSKIVPGKVKSCKSISHEQIPTRDTQ